MTSPGHSGAPRGSAAGGSARRAARAAEARAKTGRVSAMWTTAARGGMPPTRVRTPSKSSKKPPSLTPSPSARLKNWNNIVGQGLIPAERDMFKLGLLRDKIELRLQLMEVRAASIEQLNTQAALVASCIATLLSGGELDTFDEDNFSTFFETLYIAVGSVTLGR